MKGARRVLFLAQTHTPWGGMEWWIEEFAAWLEQRGWRTCVALAKGARFSDPERYIDHHPSLETIVMDAVVGTESARVQAVTRAIRHTRPDVVIPIGIAAGYAATRNLKSAGMPLHFVVPLFSMFAPALANVIDHADGIDAVVVNARLLERFLEVRLDASRVRYVIQGVRPPESARVPSPGPLRVAFVGRLEQVSKRVFDLGALERALGGDPTIELHLWGDGPDREALERTVQHARFHGFADKDRLYRDAYPKMDVIVLFSESEGSPNVIWEAMHHGVVPVVSQFLGLASEGMLRDRENALTFPVGDMALAASHIKALSLDHDLRTRLSDAARSAVADWTDVRMHTEWETVLASVLDRSPLLPAASPSVPVSGRLERHLPGSVANWVRRRLGMRYPHGSGWEEWPGTIPVERSRIEAITAQLRAMDADPRIPKRGTVLLQAPE